MFGGKTWLRYTRPCALKTSQHGKDTTRALIPFDSRISAASTAMMTSEPVPISVTLALSISLMTYAPIDAAAIDELGSFGRFCLERASTDGVERALMAVRYAADTSFPSAGRQKCRLGMARSQAAVSMG